MISEPSKQISPLEQINISIPEAICHPALPLLDHVSGIVVGNDAPQCLPPYPSWVASLELSSSNNDDIIKSKCANLLDNNIGPDGGLETNEIIQLKNKFDDLLLEELCDPCEDDEIPEEDPSCFDKEDPPKFCIGHTPSPNN